MGQEEHPKVFISYSWTTPDHEAWVLDLANRLQKHHGVDIVIDKWATAGGEDLFAFMERMVTDDGIERVLLICDRGYQEKADAREGGVGTEAQIVSPRIYRNVEERKFIPVLAERDEDGRACVPEYLEGRQYADLSTEKYGLEFEKLVHWIFQEPFYEEPELGPTPVFDKQDKTAEGDDQLRTAAAFSRARQAIETGDRAARAATRNYLEALEDVLEQKALEAKEADGKLWETIETQIDELLPYQRQFLDLVDHVLDYSKYEEEPFYFELLGDFFESASAPVIEAHGQVKHLDQTRFFVREAFLHTVARLLKGKWGEELEALLGRRYFVGQNGHSYAALYSYVTTLKERQDAVIPSPTAELLESRCLGEEGGEGLGDFEMLTAADTILCFRERFSEVVEGESASHWYPETWANRSRGRLNFFGRAKFPEYRKVLLEAVGLESVEALRNAVFGNTAKLTSALPAGCVPPDFEHWLYLDELYRRELEEGGSR